MFAPVAFAVLMVTLLLPSSFRVAIILDDVVTPATVSASVALPPAVVTSTTLSASRSVTPLARSATSTPPAANIC